MATNHGFDRKQIGIMPFIVSHHGSITAGSKSRYRRTILMNLSLKQMYVKENSSIAACIYELVLLLTVTC